MSKSPTIPNPTPDEIDQTKHGSLSDLRSKIQAAIEDPLPSVDEVAVRLHFENKSNAKQ